MVRFEYLRGQGFRDLENFNLSLLAQHAWRLLQESTSLSAKILKVIYYRDGTILEAELGSHPSHVWLRFFKGGTL